MGAVEILVAPRKGAGAGARGGAEGVQVHRGCRHRCCMDQGQPGRAWGTKKGLSKPHTPCTSTCIRRGGLW